MGGNMGKIIVPGSNEQEKAAFQKFNITLIDAISEKEFEAVVVEYLDTHNVLHLATCRDDRPRCTVLEYFNKGLTVYIMSEGGGKFANLKANPNVSFTVSDPYEPAHDFWGFTGLQVWGSASSFKKNDDPDRFAEIKKYSRNAEAMKRQGMDQMFTAVNFNVITIEPAKIRYLNLKQGFRNVSWDRGSPVPA